MVVNLGYSHRFALFPIWIAKNMNDPFFAGHLLAQRYCVPQHFLAHFLPNSFYGIELGNFPYETFKLVIATHWRICKSLLERVAGSYKKKKLAHWVYAWLIGDICRNRNSPVKKSDCWTSDLIWLVKRATELNITAPAAPAATAHQPSANNAARHAAGSCAAARTASYRA